MARSLGSSPRAGTPTAVGIPILHEGRQHFIGWKFRFETLSRMGLSPPTVVPDKCAPLRTQIRDCYHSQGAKTPDRQVLRRPGQQWEGDASKRGDTDYSDGILVIWVKQVVSNPPISVMAAQAATQASMGRGPWTRDLLVPPPRAAQRSQASTVRVSGLGLSWGSHVLPRRRCLRGTNRLRCSRFRWRAWQRSTTSSNPADRKTPAVLLYRFW